jgi:hypothetical protein
MGAGAGQVLKYNGTNWAPSADNGISTALNSANILVGNATNVATPVTMSGDATITNTGAVTVANSAITSAKILDGTIVDADISGVASTKVSGLGSLATLNAVGSAQITDGTIVDADISGVASTKVSGLGGLATLSAVGSTQITDASIAAADLSPMGAGAGQVLKYNGTNWAPATDNGISTTLNSANILVGNATNVATPVTMSGDATISNAGAVTIANNAITSAKIADGTIADADILGVASTKVSGLGALATLGAVGSAQITDASIVNGDISPAAAVAVSKLAPSGTNGQVLTTVGGVATWANASAGTPTLEQVLVAGNDANGRQMGGISDLFVTKTTSINWPKGDPSGTFNTNGSQFVNFTVADNDPYDVAAGDYLIFGQPGKPTDIILPKASDNKGRIIIIRAVNNSQAERVQVIAADKIDGADFSEDLFYDGDGTAAYSITVISTGTTWFTFNRAVAPRTTR